MSKFFLVMVVLVHGHPHHQSLPAPFHDRATCEVRRGQVLTHGSVQRADCVEMYSTEAAK